MRRRTAGAAVIVITALGLAGGGAGVAAALSGPGQLATSRPASTRTEAPHAPAMIVPTSLSSGAQAGDRASVRMTTPGGATANDQDRDEECDDRTAEHHGHR